MELIGKEFIDNNEALDELVIGSHRIGLGEQVEIELPVAKLYTNTDMSMPIKVVRAKKPGPCVFISAAIHGDEINGVEIIRRLIKRKLKLICGTVIFVPIVNVYGVLNKNRYMPDRRDLNRSFPGSAKGSLAGRVAYQFLEEIVNKCQYGIDLHTGAIHRSNLPQVRAKLTDERTMELAKIFGAPVVLNSNLRDGSLRQCASEDGCRILLYEAGEALRFDELSIRAGVHGVINILTYLDMLKPAKNRKKQPTEPIVADRSSWMRANTSGIVSFKVNLGEHVEKKQVLAKISSPFGEVLGEVCSTREGIVIGKQNIPLVQEGEAMFHIAYFSEPDEVAELIEQFEDTIMPEELPYDNRELNIY